MKKIIAVLLIIAFSSTAVAQDLIKLKSIDGPIECVIFTVIDGFVFYKKLDSERTLKSATEEIEWMKYEKSQGIVYFGDKPTGSTEESGSDKEIQSEEKSKNVTEKKLIDENGGYETGFIDGKTAASDNYSGGGWFAGGLASGLVLGLIGAGIITGISQSGDVDPPTMHRMAIKERSDSYRMGYFDGYSKKAKKKRLGNSLVGGILGTAVIVVVLLN
ncbi:MAG: hypothetical protein GY861_04050 [bacterium]|nr:hypothetical protein [bacterium]